MVMNAETNNRRSENSSKAAIAESLTPESSEDETHSKKNLSKPKNGKSEFEEKIRVGKDYQVIVPEMAPKFENYHDKALLVWSPAREIPESKLEEYIALAKERYGYNAEQALGMLFWHKHDLEKAVVDLANFTPFPDEWTKEDKVLFEQAFQFHGKCFHRIRQMLPDKSIASLVKFYYSWKKTRSRTSVMDRQEKRKAEGSENGSVGSGPDDSDVEDKIDSDDDVQQTKDTELMGNVNLIIGVKKDDAKVGKTSIMTTSSGRTMKRKQDEEILKLESDELTIAPSEPEKKRQAIEEPQSEITITPIPKVSVEAKETEAGTA